MPLEPRDPRDARQLLGFDLPWQAPNCGVSGSQRGQAGSIRETWQLSIKSMVSGIGLPAPPCTGCVTLGKLLNLSVSQFLICKMGITTLTSQDCCEGK